MNSLAISVFYTETTGWDRIGNLNTSTRLVKALKMDFESIIRHSESVINGNADTIQTLHRYFHNLDIVINGYVYEDFSSVVESE
ncbi:hypothetical protein MGI18_23115 [Bacillus sp. OVS6]|nr:hypothetical protein MGI18_23115 [Bacillus sp. OVS6]